MSPFKVSYCVTVSFTASREPTVEEPQSIVDTPGSPRNTLFLFEKELHLRSFRLSFGTSGATLID